tara:strand:- start:7002 stop:7784 length:783 start_codon:yes stop_codon:yes gene_type:complete
MSNIIAISGKKQSGKTTCGNFLFGCGMISADVVEYAYINELGKLVVPYETGEDETKPCVFPVDSLHPDIISYMKENVWQEVKIYNFADNLKKMCIDILGLTERQCYGDEEHKNTNTQFNWSNMIFEDKKLPSCPMTAREVMQYVGTDFFRKIYPNVWVDATIRKIKKDNPKLAVVVDCRFPNEVQGVQDAGGRVIRLTRDIFKGLDNHPSETALDDYEGFDAIIDNQDMNVGEQNEALYNQLADWGVVNFKAVADTYKPT